MTSVCLYFQVHQPWRLGKFRFFDIGKGNKNYFSHEKNKAIFDRVTNKCYIPTNNILKKLIDETNGGFRFSFGITGTFVEQCLAYNPKVLDSFRELIDTGHVDLLDETYYHSLAYLISKGEFKNQVEMHRKLIKEQFGYEPVVFRNTEAMYSNEIARDVAEMGYRGIIAEGWHNYLHWRSPNYLYRAKGANEIKLLLRNYMMSDDIAFRFSNRNWSGFPLTADKYASWLAASEGQLVNIFMDFETFGEHQWKETGIFEFLLHLPREISKHQHLNFVTTKEAVEKYEPVGEIDVPYLSSWADMDRDLSAWLENNMQREAFNHLRQVGDMVIKDGDEKSKEAWRRLTTSDHFYYMCTKWFADGDIHKYFNDYETPYDAFMNYMNILNDLRESSRKAESTENK